MIVYFYKDKREARHYEAFITREYQFHPDSRTFVFPEARKIKELVENKFNKNDIRIIDEADRFIVMFKNEADEAYFLFWTCNGLEI